MKTEDELITEIVHLLFDGGQLMEYEIKGHLKSLCSKDFPDGGYTHQGAEVQRAFYRLLNGGFLLAEHNYIYDIDGDPQQVIRFRLNHDKILAIEAN